MDIVYWDIETYYDKEYTLKKYTPAEYIFDHRFEAIRMGVAINDGPVELIDGPRVADWFRCRDPKKTTMVAYNSLFDQCVAAWRYRFIPERMVDVLGMARSLIGYRCRRLSLGSVAEALDVGQKGDAINNVIGMNRAAIMAQPSLWQSFGEYCANDVALMRKIHLILHDQFPKREYDIMDLVLRTCVDPKFSCDIDLLQEHLNNIRVKKAELLAQAGAERDVISGNQSFIALLEAQGVVIETKPGKRGPIPAIAKTDGFMTSLLEHENPCVQALAAARLGVKSTLEERRSERLISIASLPWPSSASTMPIPLRYSGAHTWRLSGDWKINMQNLPSARVGDPVLRKSLMAPPGHKIVVGDLAQIEARLVAWFCNAATLLDEFTTKRDPYSRLAEAIFAYPIDKNTLEGVPRHIGKAGILGCGYSMGPDKFYDSVLKSGRAMLKPVAFTKLGDIWTLDLAKQAVKAYRKRYFQIPQVWHVLDDILGTSWLGKPGVAERNIGVITIGRSNGCAYVRGPEGQEIRYGDPKLVDGEYWYTAGGIPYKLYGGALLENIIQFLARCVQMDIALRLNARGLRFIHQVHDELVFMVPDYDLDEACQVIRWEMTTPPRWCKTLPLDCDIGWAQRYGDCK